VAKKVAEVYIDGFQAQLDSGDLSVKERETITDAVGKMRALQGSGADIREVGEAYRALCNQIGKAKEETEQEIGKIIETASETDWMFLTTETLDGLTAYQQIYILDLLRKNDGHLYFDDLDKLGVFSIVKDTDGFIGLVEFEYHINQYGFSLAMLDAQEREQRAAAQRRLISLVGYNLANGLVYGPSGAVFNLNSRFDSTEALGFTVTDGKVPLPGGMTGVSDGTLPGGPTAADRATGDNGANGSGRIEGSSTDIKTPYGSESVIFGSESKILKKLETQMENRGWTYETVKQTIDTPYTIRSSTNQSTLNPATVFYNQDGSHVIVDDITREIVQVSDMMDPLGWIPDKNIVNPYKP
jgi:hypothetical protein